MLAVVSVLGSCLLIGVPLLIAWRAGLFHHPGEHLLALILAASRLLLILIAYFYGRAVTGLFAKDFCVPIMAMENVGVLDAWRRLLPMLAAEKMAFAGYVLMKIVLAIGSAIIFGIITLMILIVLLIPLGIAGVIIFFGGKAMGLTLNAATISILVVLGGVIVRRLPLPDRADQYAPMVFFQSYVLHFIGSRYPAWVQCSSRPRRNASARLPRRSTDHSSHLRRPRRQVREVGESGYRLAPLQGGEHSPRVAKAGTTDYFLVRLPGFTAGIPAWQRGHSAGL